MVAPHAEAMRMELTEDGALEVVLEVRDILEDGGVVVGLDMERERDDGTTYRSLAVENGRHRVHFRIVAYEHDGVLEEA